MSIRDGLLVGDNTVSQYDGDTHDGLTLPLKATQSSQINAEFFYRGSTIASTNHITLPNRPADLDPDMTGKRLKSREDLSQPEQVMSPTR
ncbi:hypothetical protein SRABI83_01886 [Arthrobacter sp. Bi83]|jgi:hypothetical protein|uniref:hypothetical protein n=1 Tax=Arthrobacter sp. Bi83 TaxID=2822353 RepID=UPI001DF11971|nr:hypothetical protein [Arthrobacter sp. Bi83]CAH0200255.1 hypothetical protein SRABI83_01886 [Arthrobacter sp. Bi83]